MPPSLRVSKSKLTTTEQPKIDDLNALACTMRENDPKRGLDISQQAYDLAQAAGYQKGMIEALINLSFCNNWLSNASVALSQALQAFKMMGSASDVDHASLYLVISRSNLNLANFAESISWGQYAQTTAHESNNLDVEADALNLLGINYYRIEQYERAVQVYEQAMSLFLALGNLRGACKANINLAEANSKLGHHSRALKQAEEALHLAGESQTRLMEAYALHTLGQMYVNKGAGSEALEPLCRSITVAEELGNQYVPLVSFIAMGQAYINSGNLSLAEDTYRQGLALAEKLDHKLYIYRCYELLADVYERRGEWQQALTYYKKYHQYKEMVFNEQNMTRIQSMEVMHEVETARRETEFYQTRNADLEQEIDRRIQLEKELQRQAATDALTGVANRRHFMEIATIEIGRAARHKRPLTLSVIDLDHFKQINDTCGHAVGDQSLKTLARIVHENIRPTDMFARFGGDEFVLLLLETDGQQAYTIIERIRQQVSGKVIKVENASVSITISAGISVLTQDHTSLDNLLARADEGLYKAKNAGRNCVFLAEES